MNVKECLRQAFFLNERIKDNLNDLKELRGKAESVSTINLSKEKVKGGKISDIVGESVPAFVDLEAEIRRKVDELENKKRKIENIIDAIDDDKAKAVLLKRYVHFHEWEDIAHDLGYEVRQVYRLHKIGLMEIEKMSVNVS